jgi:hypothetical protein
LYETRNLIPFIVCDFQVEDKKQSRTRLGGYFFSAPSAAAAGILLLRPTSIYIFLAHGHHLAAPAVSSSLVFAGMA